MAGGAGGGYDVIAFIDRLHGMGDPVGACQYARKSMRPDGTLMVVEPFASDKLEDNIPPIGRIAYAASTCVRMPASLAQDVGLGAQAGPARIRKVTEAAGFSQFRVAHQTMNDLVYDVRP